VHYVKIITLQLSLKKTLSTRFRVKVI